MHAWILLVFAFTLVAGCGGGGSDGTPAVPSKYLYASAYAGPNTNPAAIFCFAVYTGGALSPVPGSPAATSDGGGPIAITRDSKLLYTSSAVSLISLTGGDALGLSASQINADGSLTNAPVPYYSMSDAQVGLVAHPTADFLFASGNSGVLTVFAIDSPTGALSSMSSVTLANKFLKNSAVIRTSDDHSPHSAYVQITATERSRARAESISQDRVSRREISSQAVRPIQVQRS